MTKFGYGNFRGEITDTEISEFMEANGLGVTIYPDKSLFINPEFQVRKKEKWHIAASHFFF